MALLEGGGFAIFDPAHDTPLSLFPLELNGANYREIQSVPLDSNIIMRSSTNALWRIDVESDEPHAELIYPEPVARFQVGREGQVLIQRFGQTEYQMIDTEGQLLQEHIDKLGGFFAYPDTRILQFDW